MMQSKLFDSIADSFHRPFTYQELWDAVRTNPDWIKSEVYFKSLIRDRLNKGIFNKAGNTYSFVGVIAPVPARRPARARVAALTILYNNEYDYTPEMRALMTGGVTVSHNGNRPIVELTVANSRIIEPLVLMSYSPNAERKFNEFYDRNTYVNSWGFNEVLEMVEIINNDNHTRASGEQKQAIADYILNPANDFWAKVARGDIDLVDNLLSHLYTSGLHRPKSLCSKVCKYLSEFYNRRINPMVNNNYYFINDKVVRSIMNYYFDYYGRHVPTIRTNRVNDRGPELSYANLYHVLNELYENECFDKHGNPLLTRTQFDHILWFCYKSYKNKEL